MPLEIRPLVKEDAEDWASLLYPAFKTGNVGCLWYREPSRDTNIQLGNILIKALDKPNTYVFKCVDTELDDAIIAVAYWNVYDKERPMAEVMSEFSIRPTFVEENCEARVEFMQGLFNRRKEVLGSGPHVILQNLLCHPEHQRRGAGRMLMQFGLAKQDELGIPGYIEASTAGRSLYLKLGYEPIGIVEWDGQKYGAKAVDVHTIMIRQPAKALQ